MVKKQIKKKQVPPKPPTKSGCEDPCENHRLLAYKAELGVTFLGANLCGTLVVVCMVAWSLFQVLPDMEERVMAKLGTLSDRVARLEEWKKGVEALNR